MTVIIYVGIRMPLATLPSKQGLKRRAYTAIAHRLGQTSRYTSIKTRIETTNTKRDWKSTPPPLATLPSKQGLKLSAVCFLPLCALPLATLPSKQGLKPERVDFPAPGGPASRYTSIKTRIETMPGFARASTSRTSRYTSIKTRIETFSPPPARIHVRSASRYTSIKTRIETRAGRDYRPRQPASSRYTSIKTRIETCRPAPGHGPTSPLATLPSKQGLKPFQKFSFAQPFSPSRYTSIKTRIETPPRGFSGHRRDDPSRYTSIKTRIETRRETPTKSPRVPSRYTSIKTRIETRAGRA